ncbi:MAG TPA: alkaline phosphatase family protein [Candidatus Acidoferrales bacterium]|nr:alkaline phosphatase family protein [Candidatus Acidoferrales bacterium]
MANANCIQHIVIIIQENRTFNNLFMGFPGADTTPVGRAGGSQVKLHPLKLEDSKHDISHCFQDALLAFDHGRMDGFYQIPTEKLNVAQCPSLRPPMGTGADSPYTYVPNDAPSYVGEVGPLWNMALHYTLADHFFPTDFGPSFTAHQNLVSGTVQIGRSLAMANYPGVLTRVGGVEYNPGPWSCDSAPNIRMSTVDYRRIVSAGTGPFPCFTEYRTLADTLDARGLSWRYYTPTQSGYDNGVYLWSAFSAIRSVRYGADWANVITPQTDVLTAAKNGDLPAVSWVVPDGIDSDHSGPYATDRGPSWVAAVVNAVGKGPQWSSTAVFVLWDDWGGYYDNLTPPHRDFRGLGIRVPLIVISPYSRKGFVSHTVYEFGSILKFVEEAYDLPSLASSSSYGYGYTDARAKSLVDGFDFTQKPRKFVTIPAKYPPKVFTSEKPSGVPPDNE